MSWGQWRELAVTVAIAVAALFSTYFVICPVVAAAIRSDDPEIRAFGAWLLVASIWAWLGVPIGRWVDWLVRKIL